MTFTGPESIAVGVAFGGLNLWLLFRIVSGMVRSENISKAKTALFFFGKMSLLFVTIGLILWKGYVSPLPFAGGFTVSLVVGLALLIIKGKKSDA